MLLALCYLDVKGFQWPSKCLSNELDQEASCAGHTVSVSSIYITNPVKIIVKWRMKNSSLEFEIYPDKNKCEKVHDMYLKLSQLG